jgi:transposase
MQDHELYRRILGIEAPWYVDSVYLKLEVGEIHVRLAHHETIDWPCPECGAACKLYDHQPERQWRHLDTCQYQTILHAEPPRSECSNHGVRIVKMPWAEPSSRFTALFEALAIEWLKAASQKAVAGLLHLSWDEIHGIMERAVKRGLERRQAEPVSQIGVDEKAFRKGHSYVTLVNDLIRGQVHTWPKIAGKAAWTDSGRPSLRSRSAASEPSSWTFGTGYVTGEATVPSRSPFEQMTSWRALT